MRILLAEDDMLLGDGIRAGLALEGDTVDWVTDGQAAQAALETDPFDLVVLDIGLPRRSGLEVLASLRKRGDATPVLILTARDKVTDRVTGLDTGADDYLTKPFEPRELVARIRTLHRRYQATAPALPSEPEPAAAYRFADWHYIPLTQCLRHPDGSARRLGQAEARLLLAFLRQPQAVLHRDRLLAQVRAPDRELEDRSLDRQVSRLRLRLADAAGESPLRTVWGRGYLLDCPVEALD